MRPALPLPELDPNRGTVMTRISDSGLSVAVVGATGQVGTVMREILAERAFPIRELRLFATARSAGQAITPISAARAPPPGERGDDRPPARHRPARQVTKA